MFAVFAVHREVSISHIVQSKTRSEPSVIPCSFHNILLRLSSQEVRISGEVFPSFGIVSSILVIFSTQCAFDTVFHVYF